MIYADEHLIMNDQLPNGFGRLVALPVILSMLIYNTILMVRLICFFATVIPKLYFRFTDVIIFDSTDVIMCSNVF